MNNENNVKCPLCREGNMEYRPNKGTHIWHCTDCPATLFENYTDEDKENI